MGRPIRQLAASRYWFVTDRCDEERHLLRPDEPISQLIVDALRAGITETGVSVLALAVLSNHWHLVVRTPDDDPNALPRFMQRVKSRVAVGVNKERGRHGGFWSDRYHAIPILDEASLMDRILYTLMNPVAAGLAATVAEYPGLTSLEANVGIRSACRAAPLPIVLPVEWAELDASEIAAKREALRLELQRRESEAKEDRLRRRLPRPKAEHCKRIDPFARPERPARRRAPSCFGLTTAREAFAELRKAFLSAYRVASQAFREGVADVMFPTGSFPPRLERPFVEARA